MVYFPINYFPIFRTSLKDGIGVAPDNAQMLQEAQNQKKHGFLYLRRTVNPRGFRLISSVEFDKSKNKTQKHDDAKNAHYTTSFQHRQCVSITSSLIPSQIEKTNKRIMMITTNIPPSSFASFKVFLDNSHRTNRIIKLSSSPFTYQQQ